MKSVILAGLLGLCVLFSAQEAHATIFINEILADPPSGIDVNGDGAASSIADEFIELVNAGDGDMDLSGWYITDAVNTRHIFSGGSILASHSFLVIFGGGVPSLPGISALSASSGSLGLNNSGDTVSLFDNLGILVDQVIYGSEGGGNQSLTRWPEGTDSAFVLHSGIPDANGELFSPGRSVSGDLILPFDSASSVPEPSSLLLFGFAWAAIIFKRRFLFSFPGSIINQ